MKIINKTIAISIITASSLLGATPNIGDALKQVIPPKDVMNKKAEPLIEISGVKKYAPIMKDDKSGKTILVKSFLIEGAIHIDENKLQALISSYTNKDLTFVQIQEVASVITKEYRAQGYFVARAYIPVQNIKNGNIKIAIIEGNYGEFKLNNDSLVKNSVVQGMLDHAKRDNIVSTDTLERAMLIINDTPGVVVTGADVMPGKEVGTSDFAITSKASNLYDGYVIVDNLGSRYTGYNRLMAGVNLNSALKIGDKISLSGLVSNGADLRNGRIAYSAPLMSNGLIGELSYSNTEYSLVKEYKALDAKGNSKSLDATFTYPIKRTRLENIYTSVNLSSKALKDTASNDTTKKDVNVMNLSLEYDKNAVLLGFDSQVTASVTYTLGNLEFEDDSKKSQDESGANTNGSYSKIGFVLGKKIAFTNNITLESSLKYQHSLGNKNLDGSEDISIGGDYGVKVYPSGELSAENGYLFNIETKYKLPDIANLSSQIGVFYDRGKAYAARNVTGEESKSLQDLGLGYYANYKDFFAKTQVAWTVNSNKPSETKAGNSRILFQAGYSF